jgi:hypothetical protein
MSIKDPRASQRRIPGASASLTITRMPVWWTLRTQSARAISHPIVCSISHATAQGVIVGANMILGDFHPEPTHALVDGPQAMLPHELPMLLRTCGSCAGLREALPTGLTPETILLT